MAPKLSRKRRGWDAMGEFFSYVDGRLSPSGTKTFEENFKKLQANDEAITTNLKSLGDLVIKLADEERKFIINSTNEYQRKKENMDSNLSRLFEKDEIETVAKAIQQIENYCTGLMQLITTRKLTGRIITTDQIVMEMKEVRRKAAQEGLTVPLERLDEWMSEQVSVEFHDGMILIVLKIPLTEEKQWLIDRIHHYPTINDGILTITEVQQRYIIHNTHKRVIAENLDGCRVIQEKKFICNLAGEIQHENTSKASCTLEIFNYKSMSETCAVSHARINKMAIIQESINTIIIALDGIEIESNYQCGDGQEIKTKKITESTIVTLGSQCKFGVNELFETYTLTEETITDRVERATWILGNSNWTYHPSMNKLKELAENQVARLDNIKQTIEMMPEVKLNNISSVYDIMDAFNFEWIEEVSAFTGISTTRLIIIAIIFIFILIKCCC
ncbi:hypothetical protein PVAND_016595 [Polypedilum vanderplanki]|uniref:Uncharacterized protein n=1 Tax=Polypedilum vanderplanki TaxID=319348 RepID=A0A9J6BGE4_POLVA|nr:hypothetical protein PVAND_016595 [Polypedilum vanderplanki]